MSFLLCYYKDLHQTSTWNCMIIRVHQATLFPLSFSDFIQLLLSYLEYKISIISVQWNCNPCFNRMNKTIALEHETLLFCDKTILCHLVTTFQFETVNIVEHMKFLISFLTGLSHNLLAFFSSRGEKGEGFLYVLARRVFSIFWNQQTASLNQGHYLKSLK